MLPKTACGLRTAPWLLNPSAESNRAGELLTNALQHLLDGGGFADKGGGHLQALGGMSQ